MAIGKRLGLLITFSISTIERDGKAYPIIPGVTCSRHRDRTQDDPEFPFEADQQGASGGHE
nr:hypothetical protein [Mesorhizobium sp.]